MWTMEILYLDEESILLSNTLESIDVVWHDKVSVPQKKTLESLFIFTWFARATVKCGTGHQQSQAKANPISIKDCDQKLQDDQRNCDTFIKQDIKQQ